MNFTKTLARREGRLYNALPLIVFGGITFIGCILIAISKLAGVNPFMSMLFPIILMIGYWGLTYSLRRIQLHDEQTGDNLYYMGFLFTLTSLGVSLYQFTGDGSMDDVVRNFGIAITSTIFGIALRILFNQTRRDVQDIERATRHDLATMARMVRAEMEIARREFTEFRRTNHQMINEGFTDVMKNFERASTKLMDTLETMATEASKPIQNASSSIESQITNTVKDISMKLANMSTMLDSSVAKIQNTADRINDVQLPSEVIKNDLNPAIEQMGKVVVNLAGRMEEVRNDHNKIVSDLTARIEQTRQEQNASMKTVTDGTVRLFGELKLAINHLEKIIQQSDMAVQASQQVVKASEEVAKTTTQSTAAVQQMATRVDQQLQKAEKQGLELKDILTRLLGAFARPQHAATTSPSTLTPAVAAPSTTTSPTPVATATTSTPAPAATTATATAALVTETATSPTPAVEPTPPAATPSAEPETAVVKPTSVSFEQVPYSPEGANTQPETAEEQPKVAVGGWTTA